MKSKLNRPKGGAIGLLLFIICVNLQPIILNSVDLQSSDNTENDRTSKEIVTTSDYSPDFTGNGEDCNVTLQQCLIDSSRINILNTSDPLNNTLYEPCPPTQDFPSSYVNMTIEDIYAPNKTLIIEDGDADDVSNELATIAYFTSFSTKSSCLLVNASFAFSISGTPIVAIYLYNSTWNPVDNRSEPDIYSGIYINSGYPTATGWYEFDLFDTFLNSSKTENNTWFLCPYQSGGAGTARWRFKYTGTDNSYAYSFDGDLNYLPQYFLCTLEVAPYISPCSQTLIVENSSRCGDEDFTNTDPCATSFIIPGNLFLENISVHLTNSLTENVTIRMVLYNSTWISGRSEPGGADAYEYLTLAIFDYPNETFGWYSVTGLHIFLNNSKTENNTWFVGLFDIGTGISNAWWGYSRDDDSSGGDNVDETLSYTYDSVNFIWELTQNNVFPACSVDFLLTMDLIPENNIPKPENINLRINNSIVFGQPNKYGIGYWSSTNEYLSSSGFLGFTISADWWDVSCTITYLKIVYMKSEVKAHSTFTVGSNQEVLWNVTDAEELNYLDPRINEAAMINFTVPINWYNINVFNGTTNRTGDISLSSLNHGYCEVCILYAGCGNWFLTASSVNFLESIDSYRGLSQENIFNYSDNVDFKVSFKDTIFQNDGLINLSIYSPALINDVLNFSLVKTTFESGQEVAIGEWDVSDTVTQYGIFRVQASWNNGTAVGFMEVSLTIIGVSDLVLIEPPQNTIFGRYQQFTITVYYEDVHLHKAIDGAIINFNIANQGWEAITGNNGTPGYYLIPVDCSEISSSGSKYVEITATCEFYSTPTFGYIFEISESTSTTTIITTTTTTQLGTNMSTTATTTTMTTITETDTSLDGLIVFAVLGSLVIFNRRRKKI